MSEHLSKRGVPHLVLERSRIAERWRTGRWDSLVANGPAWHDRFPGLEFEGLDPDAFIAHVDEPYWYANGGDLSPEAFGKQAALSLERKILEIGADRVAAFVAEPLQGAGGMIFPPDGYWQEIERICRQYDVLLCADEVIGGFGRTGISGSSRI